MSIKLNSLKGEPTIGGHRYSETNVMHVLSSLLRIKGLHMLERYLFILRKCCTNGTWYIAPLVKPADITRMQYTLNS
jgi:hypothetical protein